MFAKPLSLTALTILVNAAEFQRDLCLRFINYFSTLKQENYHVYQDRLTNFRSLVTIINEGNSNKVLSFIENSIQKYSTGRFTKRYANLLELLQLEIEKFGLSFLTIYCKKIDFDKNDLQTFTYAVRNIPSKQLTIRHYLSHVNSMLESFFCKLVKYTKERQNEIHLNKQEIERALPNDKDNLITYSWHYLKSQLTTPFFSKIFQNIELSEQKISLIQKLMVNIMELQTNASEHLDVGGLNRSVILLLLSAMEDNRKRVGNETIASEGDVKKLLLDQLQLMEKFYPEDYLLATAFYEVNKPCFDATLVKA